MALSGFERHQWVFRHAWMPPHTDSKGDASSLKFLLPSVSYLESVSLLEPLVTPVAPGPLGR